MKAYTVSYKMESFAKEQFIVVLANNKEDAHETAVYEAIPEKEGCCPYSAWVSAVTYNNGNYKHFNTFEGKPY